MAGCRYLRAACAARGRASLSILQPFRLLLLSWSGRGEAPTAHRGGVRRSPARRCPPGALLSGFYLNELLLKLTTRHDPMPALFDAYHGALRGLKERRGACAGLAHL